ncbi:MAG: type II toxin-antitoxin system VapC family toxin [Anaerolineales bacterium]|nr:type II toxin-antitoxin system VapC family toxin [Anaerolineales bacterium]
MIVLDTSALLYWTLDPARLSSKAARAIQQADRILVSSISVWEIALMVKNQKLAIPLPITEYVEKLQRVDTLEILPVDVQTWLDNLNLPWEHRDPADRTIVALAKRFGCPLITSDRVIADYYPEAIW